MVIIIENNPSIALVTQAILNFEQIESHVAKDGYDGLKLFVVYESELDFILLDLELPEMDGYEVVGYLKNQNKHIQVYAYSFYSNNEIIEKCILNKFDGFVQKPIIYDTLKKLIHYSKKPEKKRLFYKSLIELNNE